MRKLIVIMSHLEATEIFLRHLPLWQACGHPLLVFCPVNSIPKIPDRIPILAYGHAEHHGVEAVRRFKFLLDFLGHIQAGEFWIFESDSFCLNPSALDTALDPVITGRDFYGNVFPIGDSDPSFAGKSYVHPPFGITHAALNQVNSLNLSETAERGFWDRHLGLALEKISPKLRVGSAIADGAGFARNTIEPEDRGAAVKAVEAGAVWFHGVKCPLTLTMIQTAYAKRMAK